MREEYIYYQAITKDDLKHNYHITRIIVKRRENRKNSTKPNILKYLRERGYKTIHLRKISRSQFYTR